MILSGKRGSSPTCLYVRITGEDSIRPRRMTGSPFGLDSGKKAAWDSTAAIETNTNRKALENHCLDCQCRLSRQEGCRK